MDIGDGTAVDVRILMRVTDLGMMVNILSGPQKALRRRE